MKELNDILEQLHQFRELIRIANDEPEDTDYQDFILEKKSAEDSEEYINTQDDIKPESSWSGLITQSSKLPPPIFNKNKTLGSNVLDYALQKSIDQVQFVALSEENIKNKIFQALKQNRVAKKSAISSVRFLRDVNGSLFVDCPECDYENEPGWVRCENCNYENSD